MYKYSTDFDRFFINVQVQLPISRFCTSYNVEYFFCTVQAQILIARLFCNVPVPVPLLNLVFVHVQIQIEYSILYKYCAPFCTLSCRLVSICYTFVQKFVLVLESHNIFQILFRTLYKYLRTFSFLSSLNLVSFFRCNRSL